MRRGAALVVVALLGQLVGVAPAQAASGDLDQGCDVDGKATTAMTTATEGSAISGVAVDAFGRIVTVGNRYGPGVNANSPLHDGYVIARYTTSCVLDTTFGDTVAGSVARTGTAIVKTGPTVKAVAIQADQKILVAGDGGGFFVARYKDDGTLDPTFGNKGTAVKSLSARSGANALAVQPDGKIVLVGDVEVDFGTSSLVSPGRRRFGLARFLPTGAIDPTFGENGSVLGAISGSGSNWANAVAIQPDGRIVLAGQACMCSGGAANFAFALVRYLPTGAVDTTFGSKGEVLTDFNFKILTQNDAFGSTRGVQDRANGVALQPDGKIVAVGASGNGDFAVANYNPDGSLNTGFSFDGKATTDMAAGSVDVAYALAVQQDGKVVAAGATGLVVSGPPQPQVGTGTATDFALVRYNTDGTLDNTFSGDGKVTTDFSGGGDAAYGLAIRADRTGVLADRRIVAAGQGTVEGVGQFAVARYEDPLPPNSFSVDDITVIEGRSGETTTDTFEVEYTGSGPASVTYATADGSATAGEDYQPASGTLSFDGPGTKTVAVSVVGDTVSEPNEAFYLRLLSSPTGAPIADARGEGLIKNDEPGLVSIGDASVSEGNTGSTPARFTVAMAHPTTDPVTVGWATMDGTATAPSDYAAVVLGTITFSPGETAKSVTVDVTGDIAAEQNEIFEVLLTSGSGRTDPVLVDNLGLGTISNDDKCLKVPCT